MWDPFERGAKESVEDYAERCRKMVLCAQRALNTRNEATAVGIIQDARTVLQETLTFAKDESDYRAGIKLALLSMEKKAEVYAGRKA